MEYTFHSTRNRGKIRFEQEPNAQNNFPPKNFLLLLQPTKKPERKKVIEEKTCCLKVMLVRNRKGYKFSFKLPRKMKEKRTEAEES